VAAIGVPRPAPYADDVQLNSLHLTTLLPYAANLFINLEVDDSATLEPASCDCVFSRLGLRTVVCDIQPFRKLSPQGMTLNGVDLIRLLEAELPARLGGGPGDYQLVEYEGEDRQTRIRLCVSPRLGLTDMTVVRETFLELVRLRWGGALAARVWINSSAVDAVVAEPVATRSGKVHPIRILGFDRPR